MNDCRAGAAAAGAERNTEPFEGEIEAEEEARIGAMIGA